MPTNPRRRRGTTLVEALFAFALFGLISGLMFRQIKLATFTARVVDKLDILQQLRLTQLRVGAELETATEVLYPPAEEDAPRPALVYADEVNEVHVLWLDTSGELKLKGAADAAPTVLAVGVAEFTARQPLAGHVECVVRADSEDRGLVSIVISGVAGNTLMGEGGPP